MNLENKNLFLKQQQIYFDANLKILHRIQKKNKKQAEQLHKQTEINVKSVQDM